MALLVLAISPLLIHDDCSRVKLKPLFSGGFDVYESYLCMIYSLHYEVLLSMYDLIDRCRIQTVSLSIRIRNNHFEKSHLFFKTRMGYSILSKKSKSIEWYYIQKGFMRWILKTK